MSFQVLSAVAVLFIVSGAVQAANVTIGTLLFSPDTPTAGIGGFQVFNSTGTSQGCDAVNNVPVCTQLALQNTSLSISYLDINSVQQTVTRTPVNFSFGPGLYQYGFASGEDASQQFSIDQNLTLVSATFSGTISPTSFQITDSDVNGILSSFFSNGQFSVTLDLTSAITNGGAQADFSVSDAVSEATPEPGSFLLLCPALLVSYYLRRRTAVPTIS